MSGEVIVLDSKVFGRSPSSNLGAKYLDQKQMETNFPDYRALLDRIEDQRQVADFVGRSFGGVESWKIHPQMYDNVFAILGGRGSGKSSVIQSLWEHLQHGGHSRDIILPIIIPETISDPHCSILGWIMATAEQVIDSIEEQLRGLEDRRGGAWVCEHLPRDPMGFFKDCHLQHNNRLRERYESLKRDCIPDLASGAAFSYDEMVGLQVHLSQKQYALVRNLNRFWADVTTYWKVIKGLQAEEEGREGEPAQPLIILMFDDVDLVPERSLELLNSTFQYFTNPNIVLILTAAEKVLEQVIWTKMLERMLGSHYESLFTDFYKTEHMGENRTGKLSLGSIDRMAREYYDKVVPPANRYHLRRYLTIADRKRYRYASMGQSFRLPQEEVSIQLGDFLIGQIQSLTAQSSGLFIQGGAEQLREAYLLMFGDKSRNIANGCLAILNCVSRLKGYQASVRDRSSRQQLWGQAYDALRQLLTVLISSNRMVKELGGEVLGLLYQGGAGEIRVDYDGLWNLYDRKCRALGDEELERYEQMARWQDESETLEAMLRMQEQERRGNLQRQMTILLVMLTFVDRLWALASGQSSPDDQEGNGGLAGGEGLANMLNSSSMAYSAGEELRRSWGWLKLFPQHLDVEAFLIRSPYALEHVEHYLEFDPFDRLKVQEYLMDTFYAATADCENFKGKKKNTVTPEERIWWGQCSPEMLLTLGLSEEQAWVETVLAMLYLQSSGLADLPADILRFAQDDREILEQFGFGGHLNQRIRESLADVVKSDISQTALRQYLEESYQRIFEKRDPALEAGRIDLLQGHDGETIYAVFNWYNQSFSKTERRRLAEWCIAEGIDEGKEEATRESFGRWVIQTVENAIKTLGKYMIGQSGIRLTLEECRRLQNRLSKIPVTNSNLSQARSACQLELEAAEQELLSDIPVTKPSSSQVRNACRQEQEAVEQEPLKEESPADGEPEDIRKKAAEEPPKKVLFPLSGLLKYTRLLYKEHAKIHLTQDSTEEYWKAEMIRGYFELVGSLDPVVLPGEEPRQLVYSDKTGQRRVVEVSMNMWVVLMLSMVEHLMPTYFAARLVQQGDRLGVQSCRSMSSGQYPRQELVNQQLEALKCQLLAGKGDKWLVEAMARARDRIVTLYIEHLESGEHG